MILHRFNSAFYSHKSYNISVALFVIDNNAFKLLSAKHIKIKIHMYLVFDMFQVIKKIRRLQIYDQ